MTPRPLTAVRRLDMARLGAFLLADSIEVNWPRLRGEKFRWRGQRRQIERAIRDYLMGSASDETLRSMARRARQLRRGRR